MKSLLVALIALAVGESANADVRVNIGNNRIAGVGGGRIGVGNAFAFNRGLYGFGANRFFTPGFASYNRAAFFAPSYGYQSAALFAAPSYSYSSSYAASSYVAPSQTIIVREVPVYVEQRTVEVPAPVQTYAAPCPPTVAAAPSYAPQVAAAESVQVYQTAPTGYIPIANYAPGAIFVPGRGWHHHPGHTPPPHPHPHPTPPPTPTPGGTGS